jgi:mono/diheme cytochrome c family protein
MRNFLNVVIFSLIMIGSFGGYATFGIPRIKPAPPPVEEKLDLGAMTMETYIAMGEKIFKGKGTCTLCHNERGRAPDLPKLNMADETKKALADPRYKAKGEATDVQGYLYESMVAPSAYVVAGFGKSGTNDTVSPMPNISGGSIGLSDIEINSVIAYLQDLSGIEVTVELPTMEAPPEEDSGEDGGGRAPYTSVDEIIGELGCGACHMIGEDEGEIGPNLRHIGAKRDVEYLRRAVMDPNADIAEGFEADTMPDTFGDDLSAKEFDMLINYLAGSK